MNDIANRTTGLSHLVSSICDGSYKEIELTEFVNLIQKISLSYLKYQEVIGKHIRWERNKNMSELDDLALDCVAGLFMRNEKNEFVQFTKYFSHNTENLAALDTAEIMVLLRRLVIKKTKQELSRIFKERDPEGAKIVRNIKVAIKSANDFSSFREMGREYLFLVKSNGKHNGKLNGTNGVHSVTKEKVNGAVSSNGRIKHELNGNGNGKPNGYNRPLSNGHANGTNGHLNRVYLRKSQPGIPEKSLRGEYLNSYSPKDPVSAGIRKMLTVIKNDERYQNFLPLDMIARIMRHTNMEMARDRLTAQVSDTSPLDDLKLKEIEKRKHYVLERIRRKIEKQYVSSCKISTEKGVVYYKALAEILDDISQGKKYDSYFKHLRRYMPQLTQKAYRTKERTIFEYLGKLIKKWFRESLLELL